MSAGPFPMVAVARPVVPEASVWEDDLVVPMDNAPIITLVVPLACVLLVFLAALAYSVFASSPSSRLDGLSLGWSEEGVERLAEADGQANERHQRHVECARLDLLKVLPIHIAPLGGFFERPVGCMAQGTHPSPERTLLLLEARGFSVRSRGPFGLG